MMHIDRLHAFQRSTVLSMIGVMAIAAFGVAATGVNADNTSVVTVHADGEEHVITTDAKTVGEVLQRVDVEVGESDVVEPSRDTEITSQSYNVNVYRSRSVVIEDRENDETYRTESAHQSPRLIVENSEKVSVHEEDKLRLELVTDFLSSEFVGHKVIIDRAVPVDVKLMNKETVIRTHASTVKEMFKKADVDIKENDIIKPGPKAPVKEDMDVTLVRVGHKTITKEEPIQPSTKTIYDNDRPIGYEEVEEQGKPGLALTTYRVEYRNGEVVDRKQVRRIVEEKPEPQVVVVGNKYVYDGGPLNETQLNALGFCESGMDPTTNTGNGFYGAFQFLPSTWRSITGRDDMPHEAPLAVQKEAVQTLLSQSSIFTQFPSCAKQMRAEGIL